MVAGLLGLFRLGFFGPLFVSECNTMPRLSAGYRALLAAPRNMAHSCGLRPSATHPSPRPALPDPPGSASTVARRARRRPQKLSAYTWPSSWPHSVTRQRHQVVGRVAVAENDGPVREGRRASLPDRSVQILVPKRAEDITLGEAGGSIPCAPRDISG